MTVLTTIVAFIPLSFVRGQIGDMLGALPMVVACALAMSLVESLLILPSHMGHSLKHRDRSEQKKGPRRGMAALVRAFEDKRDALIYDRIVPAFGRVLNLSLRFRYISIAIALATLTGSVGLVAGGRLGFTFLPTRIPKRSSVDVRMPIGVPIEETDRVVRPSKTRPSRRNTAASGRSSRSAPSSASVRTDSARGMWPPPTWPRCSSN